MTQWLIGSIVVLSVMLVTVIILHHWRMSQLFTRIETMLDAAIAGTFHERLFSEEKLSALETRLGQYLSANAVSARSVQAQRDHLNGLISDIAHQTRTPVANLQLYLGLLAEEPQTAVGCDYIAVIGAQTEKLAALMEALVKTSRLESGMVAVHPQRTDLAPLMERVAEQYRAKAVAKGILLSVTPLQDDAVFDPKWTEEAICNLLDNAIKYTPPGGQVWLEGIRYGLFCALRVRDNGPGIDEKEQAKVFERFYRARANIEAPGVGLGLTLARQIASSQGGYIKLSSTLGKGSTFAFYIPTHRESSMEVEKIV